MDLSAGGLMGNKLAQTDIIARYHGGPVYACAVSPCSYLVATVGQDGGLR